MRHHLLILFTFLFVQIGFAQNGVRSTYPVQAMATMQGSSCSLMDYANGDVPMSLTLTSQDFNNNLRIKIRLQIKCSDRTIITSNYTYQRQEELIFGMPLRLTENELKELFKPQNLTGVNALNNLRFKEGLTTFSFTAILAERDVPISNTASVMLGLSLQNRPELRIPDKNAGIRVDKPNMFSWNWIPKVGTKNPFDYGFRLIIKEITNNNIDVNAAFDYAQPIYEEEVSYGVNMVNYDVSKPLLKVGSTYAWAVQLIDNTQPNKGLRSLVDAKNGGLSEIRTFKAEKECPPVTSISEEVKRGNLSVDWMGNIDHDRYEIQIHGTDTADKTWHTFSYDTNSAFLNNLLKNHTYEYKIGAYCKYNEVAVFSAPRIIKIPEEDEDFAQKCGINSAPEIANTEPLETLRKGDVFFVGLMPYTVISCTGGNGVFSGRCYSSLPLLAEKTRFEFTFSGIHINTDYQMFGEGCIEGVSDYKNSSICDLNKYTEGGRNSIKEDEYSEYPKVDLVIPEPTPTIEYDSTTNVFSYHTETTTYTFTLTNEKGEQVFPVIFEDADGNLYEIDEEFIEGSSSYTLEKVGSRSDKAIDFLMPKTISEVAQITFSPAPSYPYSYDEYLEYYKDVELIYHTSIVTEELRYPWLPSMYVPWLLAVEGEKVSLKAKYEHKKTDYKIDASKIFFITDAGVRAESEYDEQTQEFTVSLPSGTAETYQVLHALYEDDKDKYLQFGIINIETTREISAKVVLVNLGGNYSKTQIETELNNLSKQVALTWQVSEITDFQADRSLVNNLFEKSSGLLESYNDTQKSLNAALKAHLGGKYDAEACYVFMLDKAPYSSRYVIGFMPRGEQFGYVYAGSCTNLSQTLLHELLHGRFLLRHTFDKSYGSQKEGNNPENIMDYGNGTHLAQWQWRSIHDPAVVKGLFKRDEDGELLGKSICLTPDWQPFYYDQTETANFRRNETPLQGCVYGINEKDVVYYYDSKTKLYTNKDTGKSLDIKLLKELSDETKLMLPWYDPQDYCNVWLAEFNYGFVKNHENELKNGDYGYYNDNSIKFNRANTCEDKSSTYFTTNNRSGEYLEFAKEHAIQTVLVLEENETVVNGLVNEIKNGSPTKILSDYLQDKLRAYEKLNNRRFVVVSLPTNVICTSQKHWDALAKAVFEKAGLSAKDILITLPYVQCKGIGNDLGEFYFMPGIHYGNEVKIDIQSLRNDYDNTQKAVELLAINTVSHDVGRFILDVFTKTSKKVIVHRGIFLSTNTIQYEHWEKDDVSGYPFNTQIRLYHEAEYNKLVRLREKYQYMLSLSQTPELPDENRQDFEETSKNYLIDYENTIKELAQNYQNGSGKLVPYELKNIRFREEYLNEPNRELNLPEAEAYITEGAFRELQKKLDYPKNNSYSPNQQCLFSDALDYQMAPWDDAIYNTLDVIGVALSYVGLDFITDGIECVYACIRGDGTTIAAASVALFIEGANAKVVKEGIKLSKESVLKLSKNGDVSSVKISDLGVDAAAIASKTVKYADKLSDELKNVFNQLVTSGLKYDDLGTAIRLSDSKGNVIVELSNNQFIVKNWGEHNFGTVEKKLDNGYWLVKNADGTYSIDLGFKEGRNLTGKEVNEYYIKTNRSAPYADDCIITEEVLKPGKEFYMVIDGFVVKDGVEVINSKPGSWATNDAITTIKELREDMAVLERWKKLEFEPTRVKYRVTKDLPVRNGVVGPQVDFPTAENGQGIIYFGGSQQYEIVLPREADWRGKGWGKYLKEIERLELK